MTDAASYFRSLDPHTRSLALVGSYLQAWAIMELHLDGAIAKGLALTGIQQYVLRSEMSFQSKINVMRSLVHSSFLVEKTKDYFDKALNHMAGHANNRNIIAHYAFASSQTNDGVLFVVSKSKGKIEFPEFDWPIGKFIQEEDNISKCSEIMQELTAKIDAIPDTPLAALIMGAWRVRDALIQSAPNLGFGGPGPLDLLSPLSPTDRTSATNVANPETASEIPLSPDNKG